MILLWRNSQKCNYGALSGGFWQAQGIKKLELRRGWRGGSLERFFRDTGLMPVDAGEEIERSSGAGGVSLGLQAHAHDPIEHEGEEADESMGADAVWQAMMNRRDLDVGFQNAEAALNVGEAFVAGDGLRRREVGRIGQQRQLAVEELSSGDGILVHRPAEAIGGVIGLDEAGEFGLCHGACPRSRGMTARDRVESVPVIPWNRCPRSRGTRNQPPLGDKFLRRHANPPQLWGDVMPGQIARSIARSIVEGCRVVSRARYGAG